MDFVFDNDSYRVVYIRPEIESDIFIVTFDHWSKDKDPISPSNYKGFPNKSTFISRSGYNHIALQTSRNDWYQTEGVNEALDVVKKITKKSTMIGTIGSSMAGFAAVNFSHTLKADFFISFSPQASLKTDFMTEINDMRWSESSAIFNESKILNGCCKNVPGILFSDPLNHADYKHALEIKNMTKARLIDCYGAGHPVGNYVNDEIKIHEILKMVVSCFKGKSGLDKAFFKIKELIYSTYTHKYMSATEDSRFNLICKEHCVDLTNKINIDIILREYKNNKSHSCLFFLYRCYCFVDELNKFKIIKAILYVEDFCMALELDKEKFLLLVSFQSLNYIEKNINKFTVDELRDTAISVEGKDISLALRIMNLAKILRPEGKLINKKIESYNNKLFC